MIKVVLDTNVIVSAHIKPDGLERAVLNLAVADKVALVVSAPILSEYESVLRRDKFGIEPKLLDQSLKLIKTHATVVVPSRNVSASPDSADNRFLECAEAADADYLVTGNTRHFPRRWKDTYVVNARQFLEQVGSSLKP